MKKRPGLAHLKNKNKQVVLLFDGATYCSICSCWTLQDVLNLPADKTYKAKQMCINYVKCNDKIKKYWIVPQGYNHCPKSLQNDSLKKFTHQFEAPSAQWRVARTVLILTEIVIAAIQASFKLVKTSINRNIGLRQHSWRSVKFIERTPKFVFQLSRLRSFLHLVKINSFVKLTKSHLTPERLGWLKNSQWNETQLSSGKNTRWIPTSFL